MKYIDLRSDTVTHPTEEMRQSMYDAKVGDDVWGDDPTVIELEAYAAELVGMDSALFVSSGTQGNLVSMMALTSNGDEILLDKNAHIYYYEAGGLSYIAGLSPVLMDTKDGIIRPEDVEKSVKISDIHFPRPQLLCFENTHNRFGGIAVSSEQISETTEVARAKGLKIHMDGARVFNACSYYKTDIRQYTKNLDTIQFCLSKGLSAPVGSIVAGSEKVIEQARRKRKVLGGGMRQAGVIAAAGLVALKTMRSRLQEDHTTAKLLASGLKKRGFSLNDPQTNIVLVHTDDIFDSLDHAMAVFESLQIGVAPFEGNVFRFTTHRHIGKRDIDEALERISSFCEKI